MMHDETERAWHRELPRGAGVYVAIQLEALDALVAVLPEAWALAGYPVDLLRMGVDPRDGLMKPLESRFGIDSTRPIVAAWGIVEEKRARDAMGRYRSALIAATADAPVAASDVETAFATEPPLTIYGRIVLPILRDAKPLVALELVSSLHDGFGPWTSCDPSPGCGPFEALGAAAILETDGAILVAFTETQAVSIDIIVRPFPDGADRRTTVTALHALRAASLPSSPDEPPGCDALEPSEAAVVCIDPERVAAMGAVHSWAGIVAALAGTRSGAALQILDIGLKEAARPIELADPEVRYLEAGRFALVGHEKAIELSARWPTTDVGQRAFEPALPKPMVVTDPALMDADILTPLSDHLSSPGHGFRNPRQLEQTILEGGWPMWPVLAGRTWPNAMSVLHGERVAPLFADLAHMGTKLSVRLALTSERLELLLQYVPASDASSTL